VDGVVEDPLPQLFQHDRVADRGREHRQDLRDAGAVQQELGEAAVQLVPAPQQG
jgi:hypothetical protein